MSYPITRPTDSPRALLAWHRWKTTGDRPAAPASSEEDRLPQALDELYPLPSRTPDDLGSLIDAVVEATRRRSS